MDSRIREGQNKLIDVFAFLIHGENDSHIDWSYPENCLNEELKRNLSKFAFPFHDDFRSSHIDYFTFVLTDIDGKFKFGFCRMSAGSSSTLCLISSFPWFEIFYKILNQLADASHSTDSDLQDLLKQLWEINPSGPGNKSLSYNALGNQCIQHYPDPDKLPSIPENRNLTEYYNAIDGHNMLIIFASMLFERRIIVTSRKLSRLTACVYGATSLIYPLNWQHIFIPVLPCHLIDYLSAPMPYLIGVHSSVFEMAKPSEIADAVVVDADASKIMFSHSDLTALPISIVNSLKKDLNLQRNHSHCSLTGDSLSRAFLKAMVSLIGGYRKAFVCHGDAVHFDSDRFFNSHPSNMQTFLRRILQSQSFEQFITERQNMKCFTDIFEEAVLNAEAKNKQGKGNVKGKMTQIIQEKVLLDIRKKVKIKGVRTITNVKEILNFKKSEEVSHVSEKNLTAVKDITAQSKTSTEISDEGSLKTNPENGKTGIQQMTHSDLQIQRTDQTTSAVNNRNNHFVIDDSCDVDALQQGSGHFVTALDRTSLSEKCIDLEVSCPAAEFSAVTLESCNDVATSEQKYFDHHNKYNSKLVKESEKEQSVDDSDVNGGDDDGVHVEEESDDDPSDREFTSSNESEAVKKNPELLLAFPSVQQIRRAFQEKSTVKRQAVISVGELPSVKQMVEKLETSKQQNVKTDASHLEIGTSYVAQHAAMYSLLDQKAKTSLTRNHANRDTRPTLRPSGNEGMKINFTPVSVKQSSLVAAKLEKCQDSVGEEHSNISSDFPTERRSNGYGSLLRVCSRSASMRQLDMEQKQFSGIKRSSPPTSRSKDELKESRKAIYDLNFETAAEEISSKSRIARYIEYENVTSVQADTTDVSLDLSSSEVVITLPLTKDTTDNLFVDKNAFDTSDALYTSRALSSTVESTADPESFDSSQNRVSMHFAVGVRPTKDPVYFAFKFTDCKSCDDQGDQDACSHLKVEGSHFEAETVSGDEACGNSNSSTYELDYELL